MEQNETPGQLRVCLVQADLAWEDPQENFSRIGSLLAGQAGLHDLVILPEMFTTGFSMRPAALAESVEESLTIGWMRFQAAKLGAIIVGSLIMEEDGKYYNRLLVVGQDGVEMKYDKRHLFRMSGEHEVFASGAEIHVFSLKGWRICPMICYDLRFPVWSRNGSSSDGRLWYDLLVYVANWPERRAGHWKALLQARAIENQSWVAGVNRVGTDGNGMTYSGDSMLCDALGTVVVHSVGEPELLSATLDWAELQKYRAAFPAWADADQFEIRG